MFETLVWEFKKDENPIIFSYLLQDSLIVLLEPVRIAAIAILAEHFPNMPIARLDFTARQVLKTIEQDIDQSVSIDTVDNVYIDDILNQLLIKTIKCSFNIIENAIRNIRTKTIDYMIVHRTIIKE